MELFYLLNFLIVIIVVRADVEGQREVPQDMSEDMYAPNSVPMMGKKGGPAIYERKYFLPLPMLRLKREKESPFVYRTPWHIGKRSPPDLYTASWIGSLFKPSSADIENKHNRRMKFSRSGSNKGGEEVCEDCLMISCLQERKVPWAGTGTTWSGSHRASGSMTTGTSSTTGTSCTRGTRSKTGRSCTRGT